MGLKSENAEPQVEWADEDDSPEEALLGDDFLADCVLKHNERKRTQCEKEPGIEIQGKVANIEVPWLNTIDVRAFATSAEDIVKNDVEWYGDSFLVEKC